MTQPTPVLLWVRREFRLDDHPAFVAAAKGGCPVIPIYVRDEDAPERWRAGAASRWWLAGSLASFCEDLAPYDLRLVMRSGRAAQVLAGLAQETGARELCFTRAYEPWAIAQEEQVAAVCADLGVAVRRFGGRLLFEPEEVATKSGEPFRVFTPFWRACQALAEPRAPLPRPTQLTAPASWPESETLDSWRLLPTKPDWAGGLRAAWTPGEAGGRRRLDAFVSERLGGYAGDRDRPDIEGTSRLSAHLHFGEISPRQCWHALRSRMEAAPGLAKGAEAFLRELGWREFSHHLLFHVPSLPDANFRGVFDRFPWEENEAATEAWRCGRTGYPIVDAAMRELWETGWMHNRARMVVASFLVKHLLVDWRQGEAWFWDTLVDADLANNAASWQWVAGSGADAAPYFRVFNPVLQGRKFDEQGAYVRRYVPELAGLPAAHIHAPWDAPREVLRDARVELGVTYPLPVVEHGAARRRALAAYEAMKSRTA